MKQVSDYFPLAGAILTPHLATIPIALIIKSEDSWYRALKKPSWTPPNWVFPPVWTTLYTGMGTASYLVWRDGGGFNGPARLPLALYGSNLVLNWTWIPLLFKAHKKGLALAEVLVLWGSIGACAYAFWPINRTATYLMLPYLAWVTMGSALTYCIWRDNKDMKTETD